MGWKGLCACHACIFLNNLWSLRLHMPMMVVVRFYLAAILAQWILVSMVKLWSGRFEFWYPSILMIWLFQISQRWCPNCVATCKLLGMWGVRGEEYYDCVIGMHLWLCLLWMGGVFGGCCGGCAFWVFSLVGFWSIVRLDIIFLKQGLVGLVVER